MAWVLRAILNYVDPEKRLFNTSTATHNEAINSVQINAPVGQFAYHINGELFVYLKIPVLTFNRNK
jgi:hypothetical protein